MLSERLARSPCLDHIIQNMYQGAYGLHGLRLERMLDAISSDLFCASYVMSTVTMTGLQKKKRKGGTNPHKHYIMAPIPCQSIIHSYLTTLKLTWKATL